MSNAEELAQCLSEPKYATHSQMARAAAELLRLSAENEKLKSDLQFVERWANHHATKPHMTADQALSVIQHFPAIKAITKGYADGALPQTYDPYAENELLRAYGERYRWLRARARQDTAMDVFGRGGLWRIGVDSSDSHLTLDEAIDAAMKGRK